MKHVKLERLTDRYDRGGRDMARVTVDFVSYLVSIPSDQNPPESWLLFIHELEKLGFTDIEDALDRLDCTSAFTRAMLRMNERQPDTAPPF